MRHLLRSCLIITAWLTATLPAAAQTTPIPAPTGPGPGIVDDPCPEGAPAPRPLRDFAYLCRYRADNIPLAAAPAPERRIVFIGDSITEFWGTLDPSMFTAGVVNRGISGQTTPQMLGRFQADVIALHPKAVHIMAGTNDIAGNTGPATMQDVRNNFIAMTTLAKANGIRVIIASIPPMAAIAWRPEVKDPAAKVRALNDWLKTYAAKTGATYVDYYATLATPTGAMRPEFTTDGVHPTLPGYAAIDPIARKAIVAATR